MLPPESRGRGLLYGSSCLPEFFFRTPRKSGDVFNPLNPTLTPQCNNVPKGHSYHSFLTQKEMMPPTGMNLENMTLNEISHRTRICVTPSSEAARVKFTETEGGTERRAGCLLCERNSVLETDGGDGCTQCECTQGY